MRSAAEVRVALERGSRLLALSALALLWWRVGIPRAASPVRVANTRGLDVALARATVGAVSSIAYDVDEVPGPAQRAWLRALANAGTPLRWRARRPLPALALGVEPVVEPDGGTSVQVVAPAGLGLRLHDVFGTIDSGLVDASGLRAISARTGDGLRAAVPGTVARSPAPDSVVLRSVLVIARAGWEGRFTAVALQDAGWNTEVDFQVTDPTAPNAGPGAGVRTAGALAAIDTARLSAVVALDASAASRAPAIARFVRAGGGLVLGAAALDVPGLEALSPATGGPVTSGVLGAIAGADPRRGLDLVALSRVRGDAVVIERRGAVPVVAARREGMGRVVAAGWRDTWRWRMEGGESAPAAHAAWWSAIVGAVARPVVVPASASGPVDPAPLAAFQGAFPQDTMSGGDRPRTDPPWERWLVGSALLLLVIEWTSRRTRGAT